MGLERHAGRGTEGDTIGGAGIDVFEAESGMKGMAIACADAVDTIVAGGRLITLLNPEVLQ